MVKTVVKIAMLQKVLTKAVLKVCDSLQDLQEDLLNINIARFAVCLFYTMIANFQLVPIAFHDIE